jgi:bacillithiol biosynthesis deacetylase BshB1
VNVAAVDVLAFSPHPDDVEFFCAGSMLLAAKAGLRTAVVDLTEGELSTNGDPVRRSVERDAAGELLGLATRVSLGLPDGALGSDGSHRDAVVETLRELAPRVVLAPYWQDRHPDHEAAGRIVREACFFSGVAKYGPGPAHRPARVYWYMLHHVFEPSVVIDISPVWDQRRRLLEVYASQLDSNGDSAPSAINDGSFAEMLRARATWYGAMVGVGYGEPFHVAGPIGLRSLPGLDDSLGVHGSRYQSYV